MSKALLTPGFSMSNSHNRSSAFRTDIEGLRGIAILLVVLFHCNMPGFLGGFVGVDVFFVLSGFLITGILVREVQMTSQLNLVNFYARRARRLLPAFAVMLVATLLAGTLILTPQELDLTAYAARSAALQMSNIFFDRNAGNYFGSDVQSNPLLHTWSLAVEEQFYLFWPLLILMSIQWWRTKRALFTVLAGLTLISVGIGVGFTINGGTFAFYELPARAWEFGIGGLAMLFPRSRVTLSPGWWSAIGWLALLTILGTAHFLSIRGDLGFPGWIALIPTLGAAVILIAGTEHPHRGIGVLLSTTPLQLFGKLSYSWYLWHWPILVFATVLVPTISVAGKLVAAAVALGIAAMSYQIVERPIRFHSWLLKRPYLSLSLAAAVTLCTLGFAWFSMGVATELAKAPQFKIVKSASADIGRLPKHKHCISKTEESAEVKTCNFGDGASGIHIVLFGDSHAWQWFDPLQRAAETNRWKLTTVVRNDCPAFEIRGTTYATRQLGQHARYDAACKEWRRAAIAHILTLQPTLMVLGSATSHLGQQKDPVGMLTPPSLEELRDGTRRTLKALNGLRVMILRDIPHFPYDVPTCLARSLRRSEGLETSCEAHQSMALNPSVYESERAGAWGLPHVHFLDVTDLLCPMDRCKPVHGDIIVYRDQDHLTGSFADRLMTVLALALHTILHSPN